MGLAPPQAVAGKKNKPNPGKILGGCHGERLKSSSVERGSSGASRSPRGRGRRPNPGHPSPSSSQCVFSLLGWAFADLDLFGMLFLLLPSCAAGQETALPPPQGLGGNPAAWPASTEMPPWERGNPSLSLFFFLFFFFLSAFIFPCPDAGSAASPPLPGLLHPLGGGPWPPALAGQLVPWAGLAIAASLLPRWSDGNRNGLLKQTPKSPPVWLQLAGLRLEGLVYPWGQGGVGGHATGGVRSGLCNSAASGCSGTRWPRVPFAASSWWSPGSHPGALPASLLGKKSGV